MEFFNRGLMKFAAEDQLMLGVDNMGGGEEEMKKIRGVLERVIVRSFKKDSSWLLLSLKIQSIKVCTMSLKKCKETENP